MDPERVKIVRVVHERQLRARRVEVSSRDVRHGRRPPLHVRHGEATTPRVHQSGAILREGVHRRSVREHEAGERRRRAVAHRRAQGQVRAPLLRLHDVPRHMPRRAREDGGVRRPRGEGR